MSKMNKYLGMLAAMAIMGGGTVPDYSNDIEGISTTPKQPPIPKGCAEYSFNEDGGFVRMEGEYNPMLRVDVVFKCIAANNKSAIKKYNNWKANNIIK